MISPGIRTAAATCLSAVALMLCPPGTVTVAGADKDENEAEGSVVDASAMLEIYETDSAQAESLLKSRLDASALIERLEALAADEKAHLVDCLFGRVAADHKAEYQSVEEVIVGLYGDPPEIPNKITIKGPVREGSVLRVRFS